MSNTTNHDDTVHCSFCGQSQTKVKKLVAGPNVLICNECIELCEKIISEEGIETSCNKDVSKKNDLQSQKIPTPREICDYLDQYVIGQKYAKKVIAVATYNHYKRILGNVEDVDCWEGEDIKDVELSKSNVLLIGPTGTGKTLLAQNVAKMLNIPFAIADATTLTEAGYVGEDVENIILRLLQNADFDIKKAEKGIIYIDEIDKIARKGESQSVTRDVSGEGVQQALLKILEGTISAVSPHGGRKHPQQEYLYVDTKNILFICGGAFSGIEKIVSDRLHKSSIGFGAKILSSKQKNTDDILENVEFEDILKYGLIQEFVGRMPVLAPLTKLSKDELKKVLTNPKNAVIKQYQKLFAMDGIKLEFTPEALDKIVDQVQEKQIGARGLRSVIEKILLDLMYNVSASKNGKSIIIDENYVAKKSSLMSRKNLAKFKQNNDANLGENLLEQTEKTKTRQKRKAS